MNKPQTNHLISKHNALVEAKYRLSLQEQRLIAFMCAKIKPEDKDFKTYRFIVKDFAELLNLPKDRYYTELKKVTRGLLSRTLAIKKEKSILQTNWLSSAEYFEKEGYMELCFDPKLKPYLLQLKDCFTQCQLGEILKLRSKYAFRLYELCKKNELLGKHEYELEELREMLGVGPNELKTWKDFRCYCLEKAITEINKKTDLKIKHKAIKLGRRVNWVLLEITKKQEQKIKEEIDNKIPLEKLLSLLPSAERKKKTIKSALIKYLKKEGFDYCKRNIEYTNEKQPEKYRSYLIKSLKNDYALGWEEDKQAEKEKVEEVNKQKQEKEEKKMQFNNECEELLGKYLGKKIKIGDYEGHLSKTDFSFSYKTDPKLPYQTLPAEWLLQYIKMGGEIKIIGEGEIKR